MSRNNTNSNIPQEKAPVSKNRGKARKNLELMLRNADTARIENAYPKYYSILLSCFENYPKTTARWLKGMADSKKILKHINRDFNGKANVLELIFFGMTEAEADQKIAEKNLEAVAKRKAKKEQELLIERYTEPVKLFFGRGFNKGTALDLVKKSIKFFDLKNKPLDDKTLMLRLTEEHRRAIIEAHKHRGAVKNRGNGVLFGRDHYKLFLNRVKSGLPSGSQVLCGDENDVSINQKKQIVLKINANATFADQVSWARTASSKSKIKALIDQFLIDNNLMQHKKEIARLEIQHGHREPIFNLEGLEKARHFENVIKTLKIRSENCGFLPEELAENVKNPDFANNLRLLSRWAKNTSLTFRDTTVLYSIKDRVLKEAWRQGQANLTEYVFRDNPHYGSFDLFLKDYDFFDDLHESFYRLCIHWKKEKDIPRKDIPKPLEEWLLSILKTIPDWLSDGTDICNVADDDEDDEDSGDIIYQSSDWVRDKLHEIFDSPDNIKLLVNICSDSDLCLKEVFLAILGSTDIKFFRYQFSENQFLMHITPGFMNLVTFDFHGIQFHMPASQIELTKEEIGKLASLDGESIGDYGRQLSEPETKDHPLLDVISALGSNFSEYNFPNALKTKTQIQAEYEAQKAEYDSQRKHDDYWDCYDDDYAYEYNDDM